MLLSHWPVERKVASVEEVATSGESLHLCEVVRPGKFCIRRIFNHLGLAPLKGEETSGGSVVVGSKQRRGQVRLSRKIHDGLAFWGLIIEMATGEDGNTRIEAPLYTALSCSPRVEYL